MKRALLIEDNEDNMVLITRHLKKTGYQTLEAVTSFAMAGDRERLLVVGCDGYLEKPINPKIVIQQIKN